MPVNAETYVHRCGRTARIGNSGQSFSLLSPDDEKNFRTIYRVLNKGKLIDNEEGTGFNGDIQRYEVDLMQLEAEKKIIKKAMDIEKVLFNQDKTQKRADWLLKLSNDSGIEIPEEMRREVDGLDEREAELQN
jgi:superfamily II DNA/RNA helicase